MKIGQWLYHAFGFPWITAMQTVALTPGDLLVVQLADGWTPAQLDVLRAELAVHLPQGVQCCVMVGTTRLDVVRAIDPATRPLASGPAAPTNEGEP